jgi:hypothetical protein
MGGYSAAGPQQMSVRLSETDADVAMVWRWEFSPAVTIKFSLNNRRIRSKASAHILATGRQTEASGHADAGVWSPHVFGMLNSFLVEKTASFRDV